MKYRAVLISARPTDPQNPAKGQQYHSNIYGDVLDWAKTAISSHPPGSKVVIYERQEVEKATILLEPPK